MAQPRFTVSIPEKLYALLLREREKRSTPANDVSLAQLTREALLEKYKDQLEALEKEQGQQLQET